MPNIRIRLGEGLKFNDNNQISTNWETDKIDDTDIIQPDGIFVPSMKGDDGVDGVGSTVDGYTLKEEHQEIILEEGITRSLMEVVDAIIPYSPNADLREVVTLKFRDGSVYENFNINAYWIFSLAMYRMGYRFSQDGTQTILNSITLAEATTQDFIFTKEGNVASEWQYIDYDPTDLRVGDILVSEVINTAVLTDRYRHLSMYIGEVDDVIHGFDFSNYNLLHTAMTHSKERFDNENWKNSLLNDPDALVTIPDRYEKIIRYIPSDTYVVPDQSVIVPIYSMAAWKTDQVQGENHRIYGYIPYTNPKQTKHKQDVINEINYLFDNNIPATPYLIQANSLLQFVVIGNDANDGFTHTMLPHSDHIMEDFNRYPDEKTVALFWVKSVTPRGDYTGAVSDIELQCIWSHNSDWWVPGEILT